MVLGQTLSSMHQNSPGIVGSDAEGYALGIA